MLDRFWSATAFAESGEFETARELVREVRDILLVLQSGEPASGVWVTARAMMERLDAGVEILVTAPWEGGEVQEVRRFQEEVVRQGRQVRLLHRPGITWHGVLAHANAVSGIVCILVESLEKWGLSKDSEKRRPPIWSRRLPCPLVVATPSG
ncbi:MAG: hypothetical protein HQL91_00045 [Magnetococcales bacterium]|nr:hypothetical protein [Magnetococcales bacterium]